MKLEKVESIIKNEILKLKGKDYNYKFASTDILYYSLAQVDYNKNLLTKELIIKITDLYFKDKEIKLAQFLDECVFI